MTLTTQEKERFTRHLLLKEVGEEGQEKIKQAKVLVVGAGGLGSPILLYLVAAGVGHIGIMDDDHVSESNLQRQILYDSTCITQPKVTIAQEKLTRLNPNCTLTTYPTRLTRENARSTIEQYDIVVDATDNLTARYLMDDTCAVLHKPLVYGSICQFTGQLSVFHYHDGPAYRDLYEYNENIAQFTQPLGLLGMTPGVIGTLQANEVIKIILDRPEVLSGKILLVDLLSLSFRTICLNHTH